MLGLATSIASAPASVRFTMTVVITLFRLSAGIEAWEQSRMRQTKALYRFLIAIRAVSIVCGAGECGWKGALGGDSFDSVAGGSDWAHTAGRG